MKKIAKIILSIVLPVLCNQLYNLSEHYYSMKWVNTIDYLVMVGLLGTFIIQYYGTYLIITKHWGE
jgi:hypothetical protein